MAVAIKNLTSRPMFVSLNSGTQLRLSPGEVAADIHEVELMDNVKIEKLLRQSAIALESPDHAPAERRRDVVEEVDDTRGRKRTR